MDLVVKIKSAKYLFSKLLDWEEEVNGTSTGSSLSKLKVMKLLFFASAVNADADNEGLLTIFDNFYALPMGHVESDVLTHWNYFSDQFEGYFMKRIDKPEIAAKYEELIDKSVDILKRQNYDLIKYSPEELVELSHAWASWRICFREALSQGKRSSPIPLEIIKLEKKFYQIYQRND